MESIQQGASELQVRSHFESYLYRFLNAAMETTGISTVSSFNEKYGTGPFYPNVIIDLSMIRLKRND